MSPVEAPRAVGSILRRRTSFLPFSRTETMPPRIRLDDVRRASLHLGLHLAGLRHHFFHLGEVGEVIRVSQLQVTGCWLLVDG